MKTFGKEAKFLVGIVKRGAVTRRQAQAQYNLANPSAAIGRISEVLPIVRTYTTKKVRGAYHTTVSYSIK